MKRPGPLLTLLAGLLFGLFMLTLNATTGTKTVSSPYKEKSPAVSASPTPSAASSSASPSASPSPSRPTAADGVYTGRTDDDSSAVAVSLRGGKAIAYFCDGHNIESWLRGEVRDDGSLSLSGAHGAKLTAAPKGGKQLRGTADLGGGHYTFTIDRAKKPSGIYRANSQVAGAKIVGGWIVLPGGRQVGIVTRDGAPSAAPSIDPETGVTTVDGQRLTAHPVTP